MRFMNVKRSNGYAVRQLAKLAGVTVRTLHHYDQIGLLRPNARTAAGYRLYVEHPEFRAFYETYRPGLAGFMQAAMAHYADTGLAG
jgi:hypothetical protein